MMKRLALGFAVAMTTAPALMAAPTIPAQATERLPWGSLAAAASNALCTYLGIGC